LNDWTLASYSYDGSFGGFLTCVFESFVHREEPMAFSAPDDPRISLYPEREVLTDGAHARRVYASLARRISPRGQALVTEGFLTCMEEKERCLYQFIRMGYDRGPVVLRDLTDPLTARLMKAVNHLRGEAQLYRGFVRFSEQEGVLIAEIEPKNRVLPILRSHFCTRYSGERFVIYDRTHKEALFYRPGRWAIVPLAEFHAAAPGETERDYRALWRRFYDTIAIEGRYNPKCRMTHMPKRYWNMMTEFQTEAPRSREQAGCDREKAPARRKEISV